MEFQVGRREGSHALTPAFKISRREDGGIKLRDIQSLTNEEQTLVFGHFGRSFTGRVVFGDEQHLRTFKPGTAEHFEHAVRQLPYPFALMAGKR